MITDPLLADIAAKDSAALSAAADTAEQALACHRDALAALAEGWRSETGSSATDFLHRQCAEATDIVAALRRAATELTLVNDGWAAPAGGTTAEALPGEGVRTAAASTCPSTSPRQVKDWIRPNWLQPGINQSERKTEFVSHLTALHASRSQL